jgi:hypothetical protein
LAFGVHLKQPEEAVSAHDQKLYNFKIRGEEPLNAAPPLYSNFLAISRVANDVQFEFIFLDLNQVAVVMDQMKTAENPPVPELQGKTVAKLVMPGINVLQLREHFEKICDAIEEITKKQKEAEHGRNSKAL